MHFIAYHAGAKCMADRLVCGLLVESPQAVTFTEVRVITSGDADIKPNSHTCIWIP